MRVLVGGNSVISREHFMTHEIEAAAKVVADSKSVSSRKYQQRPCTQVWLGWAGIRADGCKGRKRRE